MEPEYLGIDSLVFLLINFSRHSMYKSLEVRSTKSRYTSQRYLVFISEYVKIKYKSPDIVFILRRDLILILLHAQIDEKNIYIYIKKIYNSLPLSPLKMLFKCRYSGICSLDTRV